MPQAHANRRLRCNVTINCTSKLNACEPCAVTESCCVLYDTDHRGAELESLAMPPSHMCASGNTVLSNFRSCSMYKSHSLSTLAMKYLYACCVVPRGSWHFHPGLWMWAGCMRSREVQRLQALSLQHITSRLAASHGVSSQNALCPAPSAAADNSKVAGTCLRVSWLVSQYLARNAAHAAICFDRSPLCCRPVCQE